MRAADIVRRIWGDTPLANPANSANATPATLPVLSATPLANPANSANAERYSQDSQHSQPPMNGNAVQPFAEFATFAGGGARQLLPDLLRQHGGFPGIDWQGLALIDATTSALWIVQRPDGLLTVLATVDPIAKPRSYAAAWPARFTTPEPADDCAPAAPAAHEAINRARHCTDCTLWRTDNSRPACLKGHRLAWRQIGPGGVRTVPSRADTARPCPDQRQD